MKKLAPPSWRIFKRGDGPAPWYAQCDECAFFRFSTQREAVSYARAHAQEWNGKVMWEDENGNLEGLVNFAVTGLR